jgi:predicted O-methyltransferase YrrM
MTESMRERIVRLYDQHMLKRSALSIRGGAGVLERVLNGKGYRTALEIGTYRGVAAAEMSQYVEHVVTIDLRYGRMEQLGETLDRHEFWYRLGVSNVDLILVHDDAEKKRIVDSIQFDFAFIDGAHDARVADDFALVKRCGHVLFHDYDRRGKPEKDCVCDFVDSLPKEQVQVMDIFALWTAP